MKTCSRGKFSPELEETAVLQTLKIILLNRYGDTVSSYGCFSAVISVDALNC